MSQKWSGLIAKALLSMLGTGLVGGCTKETISDSIIYPDVQCGQTVEESFLGNSGTDVLGASDKMSQAMYVFGLVGARMEVNRLTVRMSSENLTSATVKVYQGGNVPEAGELVGSATVTSGLGSSSPDDEVVFAFSPALTLTVSGENELDKYYFVVEGAGGAYTMAVQGVRPINSLRYVKKNGSWSSQSAYMSLSIRYKVVCPL
ncbi:hypothetical protein [Bdellovibrio bacteriovorus]|uniref:hypothetical protein n=1 Tax=Bdellovibrio bacteriovorus TaxID=959 RepID=UPI003AA8486C